MSGRALNWAWSQDAGDPTAKLILARLADQANDDGLSWPSKRSLADAAGVSPRTVQRHLTALEERGLLVRQERLSKGRTTSNAYLLSLGETPVTPLDAGDSRGGDAGDSLTTLNHPEGPKDSAAPKRNIVWDVLAEHFGDPVTNSEKGDFGKTVKEITLALAVNLPDTSDESKLPWVRMEIGGRVHAMGDFRSHRRLRNQWGELGAKAAPPPNATSDGDVFIRADQAECPDCLGPDHPKDRPSPDPECINCGGTGIDGWVS
jgi:DNA-binding transcriptional ArsR family regulator